MKKEEREARMKMNKEYFRGLIDFFADYEIDYAITECVVIGREIPLHVHDILRELGYDLFTNIGKIGQWQKNMDDERERFRVSEVVEMQRRHLFNSHMSCIFADAPKSSNELNEKCLLPFLGALPSYLQSVYLLFSDIVKSEIRLDLSLYKNNKTANERHFSDKWTRKLVADIWLKKVQVGQCIDEYVQNCSQVSEFIQSLLYKEKERYFLRNDDCESVEYKIALLSSFRFCSPLNRQYFFEKCRAYLRTQSSIS